MTLSHVRLRKLLRYDPCTGHFIWLVARPGRGSICPGMQAGARSRHGRGQICIDRVLYMSSRLAWFWMTGKWPRKLIDHINLDPSDDRWSNLREADHSQNGANARGRKSKLGIKGVAFIPPKGTLRPAKPYHARIKVNYRFKHLGTFKTAHEANRAYAIAARKYFGSFARS